MKLLRRSFIFVAFCLVLAGGSPRAGRVTGLDRYVDSTDPIYHYELVIPPP